MRRKTVVIVAAAAVAAVAGAAGFYLTRSAAAPETAVALEQPAKGVADPRSLSATDLSLPLDRFGLALLQRQAASSPTGNVLISPVSMHAVLSMVFNGARGATAEEMRAALGLGHLPLDVVDQGWADLIRLSQSGKRPELSLADSLWLRSGVAFRKEFLATNRDYFAAETRPLPTDSTKAASQINAWIEKRTAGRITDLVQPDMFDASTVLGLFNTVYLNVHWKHFDKAATQQEPFTLADGRQVNVPMMHASDLKAKVAQTDQYDAVALPTSGPVTAWVIVPRAPMTADKLLASMDPGRLQDLLSRGALATGSLAVPRFTTRYEAQQLKEQLSAMGMPSAFSPSASDLSGIADVGTQRLYISAVMQKTYLDFSEQGVEAGAGSGAIISVTSGRVRGFDIRADHPFVVVLTEKDTGAPLFMGLIRDPRS